MKQGSETAAVSEFEGLFKRWNEKVRFWSVSFRFEKIMTGRV